MSGCSVFHDSSVQTVYIAPAKENMQPVPKPPYNGTTYGDALDYLPEVWGALDKANGQLDAIRKQVEKQEKVSK
jgi:hypothetical protein